MQHDIDADVKFDIEHKVAELLYYEFLEEPIHDADPKMTAG